MNSKKKLIPSGRQARLVAGTFLGIVAGILAMGSFEGMLVPLQREFVFSVDVVNVLGLSVSTGSLALLFIAGSLVDCWGARRVVVIGVFAMVLGALMVMIAQGFAWLLAGRIIGGMGGTAVAVASLASLNCAFKDDSQRAHVFGMLASAFGAAALISPVLGGIIAQRASWRLVPLLWIAVALCVLLLQQGVIKNHAARELKGEWVTPLAAGVGMSGLCLTALLKGLSLWVAAFVLSGSILAIIVLALRWRQLRRRKEHSGLNISIFKSPGGLLLIGAMLIVGAVNLFFYTNLFLQYRYGLQPSAAAAVLIFPQCAVMVGGLAGGWIGVRIGSLRTTALALAVGMVASTCFLALDETSGVSMTVVLLSTFALPAGCITGTLTKSFLDRADPASSGAASAWRQGAWTFGSSIGGVITGDIAFGFFSRTWKDALQHAGISDDVAARAAQSVRGGVPVVQLVNTPGFEALKIDGNLRTLLGLIKAQFDTFRLIAVLAAITYGICFILVVAAMWRIRAHSHS
jgi:MFS family permease